MFLFDLWKVIGLESGERGVWAGLGENLGMGVGDDLRRN